MERQTYQRKKNMLSCNVLFVSLDEVEACLNLNLTTLGDKLRVRKTKKVNRQIENKDFVFCCELLLG